MTWSSFPDWWWPYVFILLAGALPTYLFRFLGIVIGGRIREESEALVLVRCVATALVAGVIAQLIFYPNGELANSPIWLRSGAAAIGFIAYLIAGKRMLVGIVVAEALLVSGLLLERVSV
ncbi:branched-chain amino acid transport [Falsochrobactrum shanghaiense]|uniref:Branched-chain amino acid transport n=1 Tax=Falsochrobactrum shanghaiense TaxID=2201899 RepID=A0A316J8H4_9HYPH|nr:AzlD domain-containing protein [Falsochrobactrum shanghaiense]PWL17804.1 branched-chain amino acid transport [Falsochrobactrum shanghaiense]